LRRRIESVTGGVGAALLWMGQGAANAGGWRIAGLARGEREGLSWPRQVPPVSLSAATGSNHALAVIH